MYTKLFSQNGFKKCNSSDTKIPKSSHREDYDRIAEKISLTEKEIEEWNLVQSKIYLPRKEGTQLLEQFEGYFDLQEVTIQEYDKNDWPIRPAELKTMKTKETQIIKQADVVMLLHLMGKNLMKKRQS